MLFYFQSCVLINAYCMYDNFSAHDEPVELDIEFHPGIDISLVR